jgi:hypothetical protein
LGAVFPKKPGPVVPTIIAAPTSPDSESVYGIQL